MLIFFNDFTFKMICLKDLSDYVVLVCDEQAVVSSGLRGLHII